MERLEISILNFSEVLFENEQNRLDSEYFRKQFLNFFKTVPNLKPLGVYVKEGYRVVYESTKIIDKTEAEAKDFPYFLQATDLDTPFIKVDNLFHVDNEEWIRYPKGRVQKGEILIEVKGKIDKVSIVPDDFPEKTLVSGSLFKLTVNEYISKHVLLCYLICKYGVAFKDRFKTNLLISYVSKPDLYRIPVPTFGINLQNRIDDTFKTLFESKKEAVSLYMEAERILLNEIGLLDFQPSKDPVNVKNFKESFGVTGRLDAEYYQKKYEDVTEKTKSQKYSTLKDIVSIGKSIEPGSNYYSDDETGLPFMRVADYNKFGLSEPNKRLTLDFVKDNQDKIDELKPKKGTILFSKDGSVGVAYYLREDFEGVNSGAILHLNVKDESEVVPEYLTLALNSKVVQMQAERDAGGSIILHWRVGEIENVIVPIIDFDKQKEIAKLIEQSFKLKDQSEQLLEVAKRSVEIAIEQDEATALKYISDNIDN